MASPCISHVISGHIRRRFGSGKDWASRNESNTLCSVSRRLGSTHLVGPGLQVGIQRLFLGMIVSVVTEELILNISPRHQPMRLSRGLFGSSVSINVGALCLVQQI